MKEELQLRGTPYDFVLAVDRLHFELADGGSTYPYVNLWHINERYKIRKNIKDVYLTFDTPGNLSSSARRGKVQVTSLPGAKKSKLIMTCRDDAWPELSDLWKQLRYKLEKDGLVVLSNIKETADHSGGNPSKMNSNAKNDLGSKSQEDRKLIQNVEEMSKYFEQYNPQTALKIFEIIPAAYENYKRAGHQWGPKYIGETLGLDSSLVSHYLGAFVRAGITKVVLDNNDIILIPHRFKNKSK